eukprot:TRINITY_DN7226_c0_g1_i1.p1 TRINITY_DN7226_c0_g1~~TRINITY_DN7226_c0_g1_i1.p1  ORF type:complete len:763 (-),score=369.26 TRINITY_DN7226_c0_g1_i1:12-2300(-)
MFGVHAAVQKQNIDEVKRLLDSGISVNIRDEEQQTALHIAVNENLVDIIRLLLARHADPNAQDRNGWTPLHCAARLGHYIACEQLLYEDKTDVACLNKDGTSALHYLVRKIPQPSEKMSYIAVMDHMLSRGVEIESQTKFGETPLHQSCERGNEDAVCFLLEHKASPNKVNRLGETPLISAIRNGHKGIIVLLMKHGADPTIRSERGNAFDFATEELKSLLAPEKYKPRNTLTTSGSQRLTTAAVELQRAHTMSDIFIPQSLKVKVISATLKIEKLELADVMIKLQIGKNSQSTTVKEKANKIQWNEVFCFNSPNWETKLKIKLISTSHPDPICSVSIPIHEFTAIPKDSSRRSTFNLKRRKSSPCKLTLEFSLLRELQSIVNNNSLDNTSQNSQSVLGWIFGNCTKKSCKCEKFSGEPSGGPCWTCGHYQSKHERYARLENPDNTPVAKSTFEAANIHWHVDPEELKFKKCLGEGTSAKVYRGVYRNQEVAIKVMKDAAEKKDDEFYKEFSIVSSLRSPYVVFFYGACVSPSFCMVLEFCAFGTLYDVLNDAEIDFPWQRVFRASIQTMKGIVCLHSWKPQIVHRDLKSLNLLVDENWVVKVSDFGLSRFTSGGSLNTLNELRGTYAYTAPEVYFGEKYTDKADIFAFGIILWEMVKRCMTGEYQQPYGDQPQLVLDFQIIIQTAKKNLRPTIPPNCPQFLIDVMQKCWGGDPITRYSSLELLEEIKSLTSEYEKNIIEWDQLVAKRKEILTSSNSSNSTS